MASERSEELEQWASDVIFGRAKGFSATIARILLRGLSWIFRFVVYMRLRLFRKGYKSQTQVGTLVISIGNITVGGTGKTPVVELFAKTLRDRGRNVSILSRGYKSKPLDQTQEWQHRETKETLAPEIMPKVVSDGTLPPVLEVTYAGDEPYMLAKNLEQVKVLVDKDRIKSAKFAIEQFESDTLILDDGMQFLRLGHSLDIVLVDSNLPFGTGALLPRGMLREPPKNLCRADYIFITKCKAANNHELIQQIQQHNQTAEIIECTHGPIHLENVFTGEILPLSTLQDKYIAAISGIAVPESFEEKLTDYGAHILFHRTFSDHHNFTQEEIDSFMRRCVRRDADMIITTEKDAVRFHHPAELDVPVYFLRIEVDILSGHDTFEKIIDRICEEKQPVDPLLKYIKEVA